MFTIPPEVLHRTRLESGMEVVSVEMPGFQTVGVGFYTRVGSRSEGPRQQGLSHFLEHMLFKDTARYQTTQITARIEGTGGSVGAFTSEECICVYARTFPERFDEVMDILLEMHTTPALHPEEIELERAVILEEIASNDDQPALLVADIYSHLMFGEHPLGHPIMGRPDTLNAFTRDDLLHHFYEHFVAGNMVLTAAGAISHERILAFAQANEGRFRKGGRAAFAPYDGQGSPSRVVFVPRSTEQCHMQVGVPCCGRHDSRSWTLRILSGLMGESMSSRLFKSVREERGLAYQISTDFELFEDAGTFYLQVELEPERVSECLSVCLAELRSVAAGDLTAEEVERAKNYVIGHTIQDLEGTEAAMLWYGDKVVSGDRWMEMREFFYAMQAVSREDVVELCGELFEGQTLKAALVGPLPKGLDLEKMIHDQLVK